MRAHMACKQCAQHTAGALHVPCTHATLLSCHLASTCDTQRPAPAALLPDTPSSHRPPQVILMEPSGGLMEGLTSNFFALQRGVLLTAEEGVLSGTVRELVLQVGGDQGGCCCCCCGQACTQNHAGCRLLE